MAMERQHDIYRLFSRRALFIGAVKLIGLCVLGGRLAYIQIFQNSKYQMLSEDNRVNLKLLEPIRGTILDRFDIPLAVNRQNFRLILIPEQCPDVDAVLDKLNRKVAIDERARTRIKKEISQNRSFVPVTVSETLTWEQLAIIEVSLPDLPGVQIEEGQVRSYPLGVSTAHVVGYVGAVSEAEMEDDPVLSLPDFRIGKSGIEKTYDKLLRGIAGTAHVEVNALGRQVRELKRNEGQQGEEITLTLDADLQHYIQQRIAQEKSASAVVMDVHTGAIYAMNSHSSFDPNLFIHGIPADLWASYLSDPSNPLTNKVVSGQYPPGSTFKMVTALAGLETDIIKPGKRVFCPGHMTLGNHRFHCWKAGGHGNMGFVDALEQSCDVFFYEISKEIGIDNIAAMARRLGLGDKLDIEIPGERGGLIPTREWKQERYDTSWQLGETVVAAIGQGYIQTTPLQLATMTARIVNGGKAVKPYLVEKLGQWNRKQPVFETIGLSDKNIKIVRDGMEAVMMGKHGTARGSKITEEGFAMGGKTGTAQVRRISMEDRARGLKMEDLPWDQQHHALFVGYAPYDNPRYVTAVVVEHGGGGSAVAAPIAHDILLKTQQRAPHMRQIRLFEPKSADKENGGKS